MLRERIGAAIGGKAYTAPLEYGIDTVYGVLHPALLGSGATQDEERRRLAGDELVPEPMWEATRAETIDAVPVDVWPWIVQMGYGRGGFYSFSAFDPRHVHDLEVIQPHLQRLRTGDVWLDGPGCDETKGAWTVTAIDPVRTLVLHSLRDPFSGRVLDPKDRGSRWVDCSWAFVLRPARRGATRILARTRATFAPAWAGPAARLVFGPGDTVMQRTMLRGIRERAERSAAVGTAA
jgi:hypothetical protein